MDETGTLSSPRDPFFAVGIITCPNPWDIQRPVQRIRDKHHFYDEIKWNDVSLKQLPLLKHVVDAYFASDARLSIFVTDKQKHDVIQRFNGQFGAYECLARQLVRGTIRRGETMFLVADDYSSPPGVTFEENVRDWVNQKFRRQALAGVCRMGSRSVDLLQVVDLLLGAVIYEHKAERGVVSRAKTKPKVQLLDHIKDAAGVKTFVGTVKRDGVNIAHYKEAT